MSELIIKKYNQNSKYIHDTTILCTTKSHFYEKVLLPNENGCMEWTGTKTNFGYGHFRNKGKLIYAHRYSYLLNKGKIPANKYVLHACDNPRCVAPEHLWLGTLKQNSKDCISKQRFSLKNGEDIGNSRLTNEQTKEIKIRIKKGEIQKHLAKEFDVHPTTISKIHTNVNWSKII